MAKYWVKYKDFRLTPPSGYVESAVYIGPFFRCDDAEKALVVLCGQPHFRGGYVTGDESEGSSVAEPLDTHQRLRHP